MSPGHPYIPQEVSSARLIRQGSHMMYDYTEYRVLNDSINLGNSSDDYVRDSWKLRNAWVKRHLPFECCNVSVDGFFLEQLHLIQKLYCFFSNLRSRVLQGKIAELFGDGFGFAQQKLVYLAMTIW